jgi:glucosyl-dolichyl phosphate glucuronosyltransferase
MTISVVIATYNRARLLDDCLTHLARQRFQAGDEVVVIDNGSTDDTAQIIERHRRTMGVPVHHLEESRPGKSIALARGLAVATGDVLAFTDDDVNVDRGWLDAIRAEMSGSDVALVGGPVAPRWERDTPAWLAFEAAGYGRFAAPLALLDYGRQPADLGVRTLLGANLAVRREVLQQVGGFAPHLGKKRGTLLSGEDHEFCRRVQAAGFRARYCPTARVHHWVPASRMRLPYFLSWFFWSGITNAALDESTAAPRERSVIGIPLYIVRRFLSGLVGAPAAALVGRRAAALGRAIDAAFAAGYAAKRWRLVKVDAALEPAPAGDVA